MLRLAEFLEAPLAGYWGFSTRGVAAVVQCRVVRNGDVAKDGLIKRASLPIRWFSEKEAAKARAAVGDAILVSSGAYTGNVGRLDKSVTGDFPVVVSNFVRRLRPRAGIHPRWLFYLLRSDTVQRFVWPHTGGSAIPNLGSSFFRSCVVPYHPALPEQRKIAEILDTVDEAIRKTEQIIAKLEQVKQGLLHDLLTRGIDDNGELRDPTRHPEHFKDSELGTIPRSWQVGSVGSLCAIHNTLRKPISVEVRDAMSGVFPYYGPTGILDYIDEYRLEGTFVLIGEDGDHFLKFASWPMTQLVSGRFNVNNHAHVISGIGCRTDWLDTWFCHRDITLYLTRQGAGRFKLNKKSLQSMLLAVPSESEQVGIREALQAAAGREHREKHTLEKLRLLKQGLMEDLLTGRVRVNALLEAAE